MTNNQGERDNAVIMSSVMPSEKYSCSGSPLILIKGKTAMEGLSGSGKSACCSDANLSDKSVSNITRKSVWEC